MRITVITQYYKPEMGAPQNRLFEMCRGLKKNGADVSIITGMPNYPTGKIFPDYKGKFSMTEVLDDMEIKRYWLYASNSKKPIPRIWNMMSFSLMVLLSLRYLKKRHNDFIIVESPPLTVGESGLILAKLTHAKLVFNVSDLWPFSAQEVGAMSKDSLAYRILEKLEHHLYKKSIFCMGQSQEIVDYIENHGANEVYLFRNGVDPARFKSDITKKDTKTGPLKIVYAGLLGYAQGVLDICKNINFKDIGSEFHIYGAGGEEQEIKDYILSNPECGVVFHGRVSRDDIPNVLHDADCTLIPLVMRITGAVPSKIYESMASGTPIFFSGEGEGQQIVLENDLGWVSNSKDFKALKENIIEVVNDRELLITKRKNCIDCAMNKFNRPKQVKNLYDYMVNKLK